MKYPIENALESRDTLVKWLIHVHNDVNKSLGKREYSYEEVIDIYKEEMNTVLGRVSVTNVVILVFILGLLYLFITGRIKVSHNIY